MTITAESTAPATPSTLLTEREAAAQIIALAEQFNFSIRFFDSDYIHGIASDATDRYRAADGTPIVAAFEALGVGEDDLHDRLVARVQADPDWADALTPTGHTESDDGDDARANVLGMIERALLAEMADHGLG